MELHYWMFWFIYSIDFQQHLKPEFALNESTTYTFMLRFYFIITCATVEGKKCRFLWPLLICEAHQSSRWETLSFLRLCEVSYPWSSLAAPRCRAAHKWLSRYLTAIKGTHASGPRKFSELYYLTHGVMGEQWCIYGFDYNSRNLKGKGERMWCARRKRPKLSDNGETQLLLFKSFFNHAAFISLYFENPSTPAYR